MDISSQAEAYIDYMVINRRAAPTTVSLYKLYLRRFLEWRAVRRLRAPAVLPEHVNAFLAWFAKEHFKRVHMPLSDSAQDKAYDVLRAFCRWRVDLGYARFTPFRFLRPPIVRRKRPVVAGRSAVLQLLAMIEATRGPEGRFQGDLPRGGRRFQPNPAGARLADLSLRNAALFGCCYFAGMRIGETCALPLQALELEQGFIKIDHAKGDEWRDVPLHPELRVLLKRWLRARARLMKRYQIESPYLFLSLPGHGHPWAGQAGHVDGSRMAKLMRTRYLPEFKRRNAGLLPEHFTPHALRHSFVTRILARGAQIQDAADIVGHNSLETTRIYNHVLPRHLQRSVNKA